MARKKTWVGSIINDLQQERARLENELRRVSAALSAFGKVYLHGTGKVSAGRRTISAAGRKRIAAAQRARWARVRASAKK
jgi:hypothetical protein